MKLDDLTKDIQFNKADVAIDFSVPEAAFYNISQALEQNVPIVSGTTGWLNQMEEVLRLCQSKRKFHLFIQL